MPTHDATRRPGGGYTLKDAVHEAAQILQDEFGNADQQAVATLALGLLSGHARAEFLARESQPDEAAYGR